MQGIMFNPLVFRNWYKLVLCTLSSRTCLELSLPNWNNLAMAVRTDGTVHVGILHREVSRWTCFKIGSIRIDIAYPRIQRGEEEQRWDLKTKFIEL